MLAPVAANRQPFRGSPTLSRVPADAEEQPSVTRVPPRSRAQRVADTLAKLQEPAADVWVSSASVSDGGSAQPYVVPLSLAWIDDRVVLALESNSRTARNITRYGTARLGLGPTRDVVLIDAVLDQVLALEDAPERLAGGFAAQADWDPRSSGPGYVFLVLRPDRVQAWREEDELPGRTLMRSGTWVD
jgi:hypothetical protein